MNGGSGGRRSIQLSYGDRRALWAGSIRVADDALSGLCVPVPCRVSVHSMTPRSTCQRVRSSTATGAATSAAASRETPDVVCSIVGDCLPGDGWDRYNPTGFRA